MKRTVTAGALGLVAVGLIGCSAGGNLASAPLSDFVYKNISLLESASEDSGNLELFTYATMSHRLGLPEKDSSGNEFDSWTVVSICADGEDLNDAVHVRAGVIPTEYVDETVRDAAEAGELLPVDCEPDWKIFPSQ